MRARTRVGLPTLGERAGQVRRSVAGPLARVRVRAGMPHHRGPRSGGGDAHRPAGSICQPGGRAICPAPAHGPRQAQAPGLGGEQTVSGSVS